MAERKRLVGDNKMEITVLKCDRCKKEVEGLIEFSFINRNIRLDDRGEEEKDTWSLLFSKDKQYPTVRGGLCLECVMEISRWLGHPENVLCGGK